MGYGAYTGTEAIAAVGASNFVVVSSQWNNGSVTQAGAVTWVNGTTGLNGTVSASNSLVGSSTGDQVGILFATSLSNGNYVVDSPLWANGSITAVGAVTWGNGNSGVTGTISQGNSLLGTSASDEVGIGGVMPLSNNGNYVVCSSNWNGAAGAATWGDGSTAVGGVKGIVSSDNSLVGADVNYQVSSERVTALTNGNYVVVSTNWNGKKGAATWGNGAARFPTGPVSSTNSLVGSSATDLVGYGGVVALTNGAYVVASPHWQIGSAVVGAATWGSGVAGSTTGFITAMNSLVGSIDSDNVAGNGVVALSNGNYVVVSPEWNYNAFAPHVGAVTWANGAGTTVGNVTQNNSLVGFDNNDNVGNAGVVALTNGNYVVASASFSSPMSSNAFIGAVTWGNGSTAVGGVSGNVLPYSFTGMTAYDEIGVSGPVALSNGNYVFASGYWTDPAQNMKVGAVTWGDGSMASEGVVTTGNSFVGTQNNVVGEARPVALSNGNYMIRSIEWSGTAALAGAQTLVYGGAMHAAVVSQLNSLVGTYLSDGVANSEAAPTGDGNYVLVTPNWNGSRGAITLASEHYRLVGQIASWNSVLGQKAGGGSTMTYSYDRTHHQLVVGRPGDQIVSLFSMDQIFADNLEP